MLSIALGLTHVLHMTLTMKARHLFKPNLGQMMLVFEGHLVKEGPPIINGRRGLDQGKEVEGEVEGEVDREVNKVHL